MLQDLFINGAIVIAVISLGNQMLINKDINPSSSWRLKIFFASMSGILGILLMLNSVQVLPGVILDFRNIAVILSAIYCGLIPSVFTAAIVGLFRLIYTGLSYSAILGALAAMLMGVVCGLIAIQKLSKPKKWIYMGMCLLVITPTPFFMVITDQVLLRETVISYWIASILVLFLVYYYIKSIDFLKYTYLKYKRESAKDYLTGLNNVRQFDAQFNNLVQNLSAESIITILFIDIDYFKRINDTYGHQNGDKVLEDLGKILLTQAGPHDCVCRNGGEEFSVLMTDCPRDKIFKVAERIRKAVQDHKFYLFDGRVIQITISIGVAVYPDTVRDINHLVERADEALYEAKRTGRNKVVISRGVD